MRELNDSLSAQPGKMQKWAKKIPLWDLNSFFQHIFKFSVTKKNHILPLNFELIELSKSANVYLIIFNLPLFFTSTKFLYKNSFVLQKNEF